MTSLPPAATASAPVTASPPASAPGAPSGPSGLQVRTRVAGLIPGRGGATTPRRLGLARLAHLGLALVLGVGSVLTAAQLDQRQAEAEVHAAQYVRTAALETRLLTAQAAASRASLSGAAAQVEEFRAALDDAATALVEVASARAGDEPALATISHHLLRYAAALERAQLQRDTDQGREALAAADDLLRTDLLPAVHQLQETHGASSTTGVPWWMWLLPVLAWLTLVAIVAVSWYTAQVSHRVVNLGLAVAAAATVVLASSAGNLVASHNAGTAGSVAAEFTGVQSLTTAQRSGMDAAGSLATGVATRSWTADDATAYTTALDDAAERLGELPYEEASAALNTLVEANEPVAKAARAADWDEASRLLRQTSAEAPAAASDGFLAATLASVDAGLAELRAAADAQEAQTTTFAVLAVACALASALAGALGIGQRLKEYR